MLRKIRESKGLSLRQLEKISGASKIYLTDMENHPTIANPTVDKLFKLEKALNIEYGTVYLYLIESRIDED